MTATGDLMRGAARASAHRRPPALPIGAEKVVAVRRMFDTIAPRYEAVNRITSLGMDRGWRRRCIDALGLGPGSAVLDVACGTGDLCRELVRRDLAPTGLDLSKGMLRHARTSAPMVLGDALCAPFPAASFDGAVSGFALRNVTELDTFFDELARLVRPGGRICVLDLGQPESRLLRPSHHLWCNLAVPFIGSVMSDAQAYRYLPRSLAYLPPPEELVNLMEKAGFAAVEHVLLAGGTAQLYSATRLRPARRPGRGSRTALSGQRRPAHGGAEAPCSEEPPQKPGPL